MEIQKIFSDMYDEERLYSVLMTEEELRLFNAGNLRRTAQYLKGMTGGVNASQISSASKFLTSKAAQTGGLHKGLVDDTIRQGRKLLNAPLKPTKTQLYKAKNGIKF